MICGNQVRALLLVLVGLAFASPVDAADRVKFGWFHGEEQVENLDLCFFELKGRSPLSWLFGAGEIKCVDGSKTIHLTVGGWGYYAVQHGKYVSIGQGRAYVSSEAGTGFKRVKKEVVPAMGVAVHDLDHRLVIYCPGFEGDRAEFLPVPDGANSVTVPRNRPWRPVKVVAGRPEAMGVLRQPGDTTAITEKDFSSESDRIDVLVEFTFERQRNKTIDFPELQMQLADRAVHGDRLIDVYHDTGIAIFANVPRNQEWTIKASGPYWTPSDTAITHRNESRVLAATDVELRSAVAVAVTPPPPTLPNCLAADRLWNSYFDVSVESCVGDACTTINPVLYQDSGEFIAPHLPAGAATITITHLGLPVQKHEAILIAGETTSLNARFDLGSLRGVVSIGGRPVRAVIRFRSLATISDEAGHFEAHLPRDWGVRPVEILTCDGARNWYIPEDPIARYGYLELNLPGTDIQVLVRDSDTGTPLEGAAVHSAVEIVQNDTARDYLLARATTREDGKAALEPTTFPDTLELCARHPDYESKCELVAADDEIVELSLKRIEHTTRRIQTAHPLGNGRLAFVSPIDGITEQVRIKSDGTFTTVHSHLPPEYAVLVSNSHPLTIFASPDRDVLTVPDEPIVTLMASAEPLTRFTIVVNGRIIPPVLLTYHQGTRGAQASAGTDGIVVSDVMFMGSLSVIVDQDQPQLPPKCFPPAASTVNVPTETYPPLPAAAVTTLR